MNEKQDQFVRGEIIPGRFINLEFQAQTSDYEQRGADIIIISFSHIYIRATRPKKKKKKKKKEEKEESKDLEEESGRKIWQEDLEEDLAGDLAGDMTGR